MSMGKLKYTRVCLAFCLMAGLNVLSCDGENEETPCLGGYDMGGNCIVSDVCPTGTYSLGGFCLPVEEMACPSGQHAWNGTCVPDYVMCGDDERVNDFGECVPSESLLPSCPSGQHFDSNGQCVADVISCSSGQHFDSNGQCVADVISCPSGQHFDSNGQCVADVVSCPSGQHFDSNGQCVADVISCPSGQHFDFNGQCIPDVVSCPSGQHFDFNGQCIPDVVSCPSGQHLDGNGQCIPDVTEEGEDPCVDKVCTSGTCMEGVCVTESMKHVPELSDCDPETFVEFCDGNRVVYCDRGIVQIGECEEGCVVYDETYWWNSKQQAGCIDGGDCQDLDSLEQSCFNGNKSFVYARACQRTTRNLLKWVSVDGYYCRQACNPQGNGCLLADGECNPYDRTGFACDRRSLKTCYLDSNLYGVRRTEYCLDACVSVNGVAQCGYACANEGAHVKKCVHADTMDYYDSGNFVCKRTDSGVLYSVWTGSYDYCEYACNESNGECGK